MVEKFGLNQFVGQLIGIVTLLMVICISVVISFYYTNNQVLVNYTIVQNEENERNALIRVEMLVNLSRQAEKSFYAEQNSEDAQRVSHYLGEALNELADMTHEESRFNPVKMSNRYSQWFKLILNSIETPLLNRSHCGVSGVLVVKRGVSLELRQAAYDGLRSQLSQYNTHNLHALMGRIRWQEYEFYLYWAPRYISNVQTLLAEFRATLQLSNLNHELSAQLNTEIDHYERELQHLAKQKKRLKPCNTGSSCQNHRYYF